jgi:hypothetical protein
MFPVTLLAYSYGVSKDIASLSFQLALHQQDDHRRTKQMNWMGIDIPVQFFDYEADGKRFVIWGLTAHILTRAAAIILQREPSFAELPRPESAPVVGTDETKP